MRWGIHQQARVDRCSCVFCHLRRWFRAPCLLSELQAGLRGGSKGLRLARGDRRRHRMRRPCRQWKSGICHFLWPGLLFPCSALLTHLAATVTPRFESINPANVTQAAQQVNKATIVSACSCSRLGAPSLSPSLPDLSMATPRARAQIVPPDKVTSATGNGRTQSRSRRATIRPRGGGGAYLHPMLSCAAASLLEPSNR